MERKDTLYQCDGKTTEEFLHYSAFNSRQNRITNQIQFDSLTCVYFVCHCVLLNESGHLNAKINWTTTPAYALI